MSTEIFWKKRISLIITGCISTALVVVFLFYACFLTGSKKVTIDKHFYFVVSTEPHLEAGAHFVEQNGGAGYILQSRTGGQVTYSVYLKSREAEAVQVSLQSYSDVEIVAYSVDSLYIHAWQKNQMKAIEGALASLYGCIEVLLSEIKNLDKGQTQEDCKGILETLGRQLEYLSQTYSKFENYSVLCGRAAESLRISALKTVFAKNLRYIACELCVGYIRFAQEFSL